MDINTTVFGMKKPVFRGSSQGYTTSLLSQVPTIETNILIVNTGATINSLSVSSISISGSSSSISSNTGSFGSLNVTGTANIFNINVTGTSNISNSSSNISSNTGSFGSLNVTGTANILNLNVSGSATISGLTLSAITGLTIVGATTGSFGNLLVTGSAQINGNLSVTGSAQINGSLTAATVTSSGAGTFGTISITGATNQILMGALSDNRTTLSSSSLSTNQTLLIPNINTALPTTLFVPRGFNLSTDTTLLSGYNGSVIFVDSVGSSYTVTLPIVGIGFRLTFIFQSQGVGTISIGPSATSKMRGIIYSIGSANNTTITTVFVNKNFVIFAGDAVEGDRIDVFSDTNFYWVTAWTGNNKITAP